MKLKMIAGPRPGQTDMILNTSVGTFEVALGDTVELPDQAGHEVMTQWGACFQMAGGSVESLDEAVEEEATKMAKGYKHKAASAKE